MTIHSGAATRNMWNLTRSGQPGAIGSTPVHVLSTGLLMPSTIELG
jgi:hypothetical protein